MSFHRGHGTIPGDERADHSFTPRDDDFEKSRVGGRAGRGVVEDDRHGRNSVRSPQPRNHLPRFATSATRLRSRHRSVSGIKPKNPQKLRCPRDDPTSQFARRGGNVAVIPSETSAQAASECESRTGYVLSAGDHTCARTRGRTSPRQCSQ